MQQQISLYLDLKPGQSADLETVAKAALAFDAALKSIATFVDPFTDVRVELESGTDGSLSLNSILKAGKLSKADLRAVAIAIATYFASETVSWTYSKILDSFADEPEIHATFTEDEKEAVAKRVAELVSSKVGERGITQVYRELQRDPAITGVGITTKKAGRPSRIIPREQFEERGRLVEEAVVEGQRSTTDVQQLTLVSPVLMQANRQWKFRGRRGEFGAKVKDLGFLSRVLSGREPIHLSDGILMTVVITTVEERVDGLWRVKSRTIDEVTKVEEPPRQGDLLSSGQEPDHK